MVNNLHHTFLINPKAGTDRSGGVVQLVRNFIQDKKNVELVFWEPGQSWEQVAGKIRQTGYDMLVAVGGDGTVNCAGSLVTGTDKTLGIIPCGSGNGLARHLGIPLDHSKALEKIYSGAIKRIDSCYINDLPFFCTAGIGFDAHIGNLFAQNKKRGFFTYAKMIAGEFFSYRPQTYRITSGSKSIERKAFLLTAANAAQYGNNAFIAPQADISDGWFDLCSLKPLNLFQAIGVARRLFNKTIHYSALYHTEKMSEVIIERNSEGPIHTDGEPRLEGRVLKLRIVPSSLKVIC